MNASTDFTDFDLRKFERLSPSDRVLKLERDMRVRNKREKDLRAAEAELVAHGRCGLVSESAVDVS